MGISHQLCKSYFNDFIHNSDFKIFEKTAKSLIYENSDNDEIIIVTNDISKMMYYMYAIKNSYKYIPKIYDLLYDWKNNLYFIRREKLYPCTNTKKLTYIDKIKSMLKVRVSYDELTNELLSFHYSNEAMKYNIIFDFGPHWLMEDKKGKIVVADAFESKYIGLI